MIRSLCLLLICLSFSCSSLRVGLKRDTYNNVLLTFPTRYEFADDFPNEQKLPVRQAFQYWNSLFVEDVFFEEKESNHCENNIVISLSDKIYERNPEAHGTAGNVSVRCGIENFTKGNIVFYGKWLLDSEVMKTNIARHEIGHYIFGNEHSPIVSDLMYRYINYDSSNLFSYENKSVSLIEYYELKSKYGKLVKDE